MTTPLRLALAAWGGLFRPRLLHLVLHVTSRCNLRCPHCFVDHDGGGPDLGLASFRRIGARCPSLFWLDVGGGEPFLRDDLADVVDSFRSRVVTIPTNGWLVPEMVGQVGRLLRTRGREVVVSISLDGLRERHDALRAPGSWDRAWTAFDELRRLGGVSVKVNTVLTRENAADLLPLMEEVHRRGADFHSVVLLRGTPRDPAQELPPLATLRALAPRMFAILGRYTYGRQRLSARILRNYHRYLWDVSLRTLEEGRQAVPCLAGRTQAVVWADGRVAPCEMLPPAGDATKEDLPAILAGAPWRLAVDRIRAGACHCTHNCALFDSILFRPGNWGRLLHVPAPGGA